MGYSDVNVVITKRCASHERHDRGGSRQIDYSNITRVRRPQVYAKPTSFYQTLGRHIYSTDAFAEPVIVLRHPSISQNEYKENYPEIQQRY